jgi:hypothetical protein
MPNALVQFGNCIGVGVEAGCHRTDSGLGGYGTNWQLVVMRTRLTPDMQSIKFLSIRYDNSASFGGAQPCRVMEKPNPAFDGRRPQGG